MDKIDLARDGSSVLLVVRCVPRSQRGEVSRFPGAEADLLRACPGLQKAAAAFLSNMRIGCLSALTTGAGAGADVSAAKPPYFFARDIILCFFSGP